MKKTFSITAIIFSILWLVGFLFFAWQINHFTAPAPDKTDAIIALTGGRNRINEAVKLLEQGKADKLFISGVAKDISLKNIFRTQHINSANSPLIEIGHKAFNTIGNAVETKEWVEKNHINSIRLVTSNYHVFRSMIEFREQNPNLKIIIHPVYSEKIEKKWWTSWQTFSLILKEYNKFLYAYIRNKFIL